MPENINLLKDILLHHVVPANARSTSLSNGDIDTLNGDPVEVAISGADVSVNDASVIVPDIIASNGIIHVIDSVLLPPADVEAVAKPTATHMPTRKPNNKHTEVSFGFEYCFHLSLLQLTTNNSMTLHHLISKQ